MARTIKIIEAPRLNNLVTSQGTTLGLVALVNAYLATLVGPVVLGWSLDSRIEAKRMSIQWMFTIVTETGGPVLANPFTLSVLQNTSMADLQVAVDALYTAALPTQYLSDTQINKLDSDLQGFSKQYVASTLQNALAVAKNNFGGPSQVISSGLVAAVQNADRFAIGAQGGTGQATEANANILIPRAGLVRSLSAKASAAVGGGATVTVDVRKNGVSTLLTLAFANADGTTLKTIATPSVAVAAGDLLTIRVSTDNAGAPAADFQAAVELV